MPSTTNLKLDDATKVRVEQFATSRRKSPHWVIREAIEQYLVREEKRERLHQDALAAWNHYRETGLHLSANEADVWLGRLEAGEILAQPECHD